MKPIHIELSDEAIDIPMSKVLGQDSFLELINVFYTELFAIWHPTDNFVMFVALNDDDGYIDDFVSLLDEIGNGRLVGIGERFHGLIY